MKTTFPIPDPHCLGMSELPNASTLRVKVSQILIQSSKDNTDEEKQFPELFQSSRPSHLFQHLSYGLAYTVGSALGTTPPSTDDCLAAYQLPNRAGLTAGARAWAKHCHRSSQQASKGEDEDESPSTEDKTKRIKRKKEKLNEGWWGTASGPVPRQNEKSLELFWKIMMNGAATWRNLHWLPHQVLVYEVRVSEGYGMRWSRDMSPSEGDDDDDDSTTTAWIFRGFLEPQMENGHQLGWRHVV